MILPDYPIEGYPAKPIEQSAGRIPPADYPVGFGPQWPLLRKKEGILTLMSLVQHINGTINRVPLWWLLFPSIAEYLMIIRALMKLSPKDWSISSHFGY